MLRHDLVGFRGNTYTVHVRYKMISYLINRTQTFEEIRCPPLMIVRGVEVLQIDSTEESGSRDLIWKAPFVLRTF